MFLHPQDNVGKLLELQNSLISRCEVIKPGRVSHRNTSLYLVFNHQHCLLCRHRVSEFSIYNSKCLIFKFKSPFMHHDCSENWIYTYILFMISMLVIIYITTKRLSFIFIIIFSRLTETFVGVNKWMPWPPPFPIGYCPELSRRGQQTVVSGL